MSAMEEDSIAGHVSSLRKSFGLVPPAAVPAILDCILDTTGMSPSLLFSSLLDDLPNLIKDNISDENGILGPDECNSIASFMRALCHILKKYGSNDDAVKLTICRGFIPLTKILNASNCELLNQIVELIIEVVIKSNTWGAIEETLIPYSLRSVGLSLGMVENDESSFYRWSRGTFVQVPRSKLCEPILDEGSIFSLSGFLPLPISCHILTSVVAAALRFYQASQSTLESTLENGCHVGKFIGNVLWDLCELLFRMLLQCAEHRSCATCILVPFIFWAFSSHDSFGVSPHKQPFVFSRNYFCRKIWMCCTTLFSLGPSERKDAYGVMSLYLSFFSTTKGSTDGVSNGSEEFDVRAEKELWDEIKKALVDKDGVVRKQSLHMLKTLLQTEEGTPCVSKKNLQEKISNPQGMTKRAQWAEKEAKSLGVGRIIHSPGSCSNARQRWEAFLLLYEMLEEYGTHLVEAAWAHQIAFLLQVSCLHGSSMNSVSGGVYLVQMETTEGIFTWLAILWERGFSHENPQVRCLIMRSFLSIDWKNSGNNAKLVPESFILSSFIPGLNDPVHHKDFGVKGVYTSETIEGAVSFLYQFSGHFHLRARLVFLCSLASVSKQHSFGRAGLMALAACISSAGCGAELHYDGETEWCKDISCGICQQESVQESVVNDKGNLLDLLRLIIESSKQHFNSCYRLQVCQKVIEAAALVIYSSDLPLEMLLHFVSALPREFTDCGGSLGVKLQEWFSRCSEKHCHSNSCSTKTQVLKCLYDYPKIFIRDCIPHDSVAVYDDEEVDAWGVEAQRWARVLFLVVTEEDHLEPLFKFLRNYGINICIQRNQRDWIPVKFLILALSLVQELQIVQEKTTSGITRATSCERVNFPDTINQRISAETASFFNKFCQPFLFILEELVSFAKTACAIFWSNNVVDTVLPSSLRGKLGGPSQRRSAASTTTAVLQAIISMKAVALISSWCALFKSDILLDFSFTFLWRFYWKVVSFPTRDSETCAEIRLAAYEALVPVLKALMSASSILSLNSIVENDESQLPNTEGGGLLDPIVLSFLQNINNLLATGVLTRSRRAILMNWKWHCLDSILSLPYHAILSGAFSDGLTLLFSDGFVRCVFADLVESLENAGEGSVLPILRSVRLVLGLFALGRTSLVVSSSDGVNAQMMWQLVHSSWVLHVNCNKRRVAAIAALLSSVLHSSVFSDANMHKTTDDTPGPLKWFVMKIIEEGTKSPRTIRLAALHLTGLWLSYPRTIRYYLKELKLLSLYGSVAFDEDFEAELSEIHEARTEVSLLAKSPDPELTEAFINTELYARVSVGVLFYKLAKLADTLGSDSENEDCHLALESGKLFLLELLDSAVNEKDLAKELYKKYSAIHRRKVRVWQMICILSRFVDEDIVQQVTFSLHICLHRNNLPAVRQYLETFAIHIYLKFPSLVRQQLLPIFQDYNMRPQALASYVFITANVILHATEMCVRSRHLNDLLPHIVPLLTSHHHSLRGFTQLLVYQVLSKVMPALDSNVSGIMSLEKNCFENLKLYLSKNPDCTRLRASMEGFLDAFNPEISATPNGIFANRDKELQFECVPTSLMEQVIFFLNDAREDLRCSMANDIVTIKNDYLKLGESYNSVEGSRKANEERFLTGFPKDVLFDFQKKVTLSKHESQDADPSSMFSNIEIFKPLLEMEKEDLLLDDLLQSRNIASERIRASRQPFILVASLLDRIPNLAGLARSCEVFKAAGLAIADATIIHDKQFQLISVTAEKWVPIIEVPVCSLKAFLEKKKREGFSILGLEQTANSIPLDQYAFPKKMVLVLGREKEGIPVDIIHVLDACVEIPQLGVVRSLNVHVSGAIALWEYTRQQRSLQFRSS